MTALAVVGALAVALIALGAVAVWIRHQAYSRYLRYSPKQDRVLGIAEPAIETIPLVCKGAELLLPDVAIGAASAVLELDVRASLIGRLSDPAIEITANGFHDLQYVERGTSGARFLNITRALGASGKRQSIHLRGHGVSWGWGKTARLHLCRERPTAEDRVLVIAPHPDDAEIAAFGLYSDTRSTVVTLTAGDASDRYTNSAQPWLALSRRAVASTRVWDSLTIPQLGGVPPEQAINLCFPDGRLNEMHCSDDVDIRGEGPDAPDFSALRRMNRSPLVGNDSSCAWTSLVRDLGRIVAHVKPTIVVSPHPSLDPHPDHCLATVAVLEALQSVGHTARRMFLYTVHNRRSELWPFGPAGSGVALLPILPEDGICASAFYSHRLSIERQQQKFVALEAMHDLRDMQWPVNPPSFRQVGLRFAAELRALARGMDRIPTSYLRRAVRPDEWFFVSSTGECLALVQHTLERGGLRRVA